MKYIKLLFILLFLNHFIACNTNEANESKLGPSEAIAVKTYQVKLTQEKINISTTGILTTENRATYAFKTGGVIDRIYKHEGDVFKKGELLASLKIEEIDAGYSQAKLSVEKAERDFLRIQNLYKDSVATLEQLQDTKTAFDVAQQQFEAVRFNKEYALIYATTDGFVTQKIANEGEIISGGMPVLQINENYPNSWVLKVGLSDKDWALVEVGNNAQIVFDAYPTAKFMGKVSRKPMATDKEIGVFQVEIKLNSEMISPAVGLFGKATIATNSLQNYRAIPYDALIEADGTSAFVFVPLPNGKVKKQAIEIVAFDNDKVYVAAGLANVDKVVISNAAFLNSSSTIQIIK